MQHSSVQLASTVRRKNGKIVKNLDQIQKEKWFLSTKRRRKDCGSKQVSV